MNKDPSADHYDIVVIGAGAAGLTAAALMAKAGKKVLVAEQEDQVGGYLRPLLSGPFQFDIGPRLLMGCNPDGPYGPGATYSLLAELGVAERCEFIQVQPFANIRFPDLTFPFWSGRQACIEELHRHFSSGLENMPRMFDLCGRVYHTAVSYMLAQTRRDHLKLASDMLGLLPYMNATLEDVLIRFFPDLRPRLAFQAIWQYVGLGPQQASFLSWAFLMAAYVDEGGYFCRGGLHSLTDALACSFTNQGGELVVGRGVKQIFVRNGKAAGVKLADGREVFAPIIVATIDPRIVFSELTDTKKTSTRYQKKLESLELSIKGISISLVTDLDLPALGFGFENIVYDRWDSNQIQRNLTDGKIATFAMTVPTLADPDLAPPGTHLVSAVTGFAGEMRLSSDDYKRYVDIFIAELYKLIPQLDDHLIPTSQDRREDGYVVHEFGPFYGWACSPKQSGLNRLSQFPPVEGLFLAGQWTRPGPGVMAAQISAKAIVQTILK